MSDTPLTDAVRKRYAEERGFLKDMEQLERQLAEAIGALKVLRYWLTTIETRNRSEDVYYEYVDDLLRQLAERRKP